MSSEVTSNGAELTLRGRRRDSSFEVLSNRRRRHVIHYLLQTGGTASVSDLSRQLAAWENDVQLSDVTSKERKRIYTALRQAHLPKMAQNGVVEFDGARGTVRLTDEGARLRMYLELVPENEIPWSVYYLGVSVFGLFVAAMCWFAVPPFSLLPTSAWTFVVAGLFFVSSGLHALGNHRSRLPPIGPPPEVAETSET